MKNLKQYIIAICACCLVLSACQKDYPAVFEGKPYVRFQSDENESNIYVQQIYSNFFFHDDESRTRDTVYLSLASVGAIPNKDLKIDFEAFDSDTMSYPERIEENTLMAEAGKHYVSFDSEEMQNLLIFHGDIMQDTVPLIVLRDPSMKNNTYRLTIRLATTEDAQVADPIENRVVIYITDRVSKPSNWSLWDFGAYGDVKMAFMIRNSDLKWTEEDIDKVLEDSFLYSYYVYKFKELLKKENEALGSAGPLREADGTVVSFERPNY
ncbi:DUF4843 domain-containing protein [uncultured Sunxiuqinia sp.]|uniref:DUF4843 domain-containing protein n=1 Tax=uncultured Sunxiuqinia sp. TaxID=1573825 RepID=UPI002AA5E76D|nr:DUF4843 domain-containing protein [uncultured Sunxiuqinia sp.]